MQPGARIDYETLRRINPEAARRAVLEYLASCGHNIAETARVFGITRPVVYDILAKQGAGNLQDRSRAPHRQPHKSLAAVGDQVMAAKNKTRLSPPATPRRPPLAESPMRRPAPALCGLVRRQTL